MKDQTIYKYIVRDLLVVVWPSDVKSGQYNHKTIFWRHIEISYIILVYINKT